MSSWVHLCICVHRCHVSIEVTDRGSLIICYYNNLCRACPWWINSLLIICERWHSRPTLTISKCKKFNLKYANVFVFIFIFGSFTKASKLLEVSAWSIFLLRIIKKRIINQISLNIFSNEITDMNKTDDGQSVVIKRYYQTWLVNIHNKEIKQTNNDPMTIIKHYSYLKTGDELNIEQLQLPSYIVHFSTRCLWCSLCHLFMRTGNSVENIMFKSIQRLRKLPVIILKVFL